MILPSHAGHAALLRTYLVTTGLPLLGLIGSALLWHNASASRDDPGEAQTARLGFLATGCSFLASLAVALSGVLPLNFGLVPRGNALLVVCVAAVLLACLGLALTLSNAHGRMRLLGAVLSFGAICLACFYGWGLMGNITSNVAFRSSDQTLLTPKTYPGRRNIPDSLGV